MLLVGCCLTESFTSSPSSASVANLQIMLLTFHQTRKGRHAPWMLTKEALILQRSRSCGQVCSLVVTLSHTNLFIFIVLDQCSDVASQTILDQCSDVASQTILDQCSDVASQTICSMETSVNSKQLIIHSFIMYLLFIYSYIHAFIHQFTIFS